MAAGQGFKTFTTGEVLTAGDVNGYLMQGINVFTNATARDAAITAPAEGQFAFTKDNNSLWYYDGAAWVASGATGDIEGVTATSPLTGGGTSGTVTVGIQDASTSQRGSVQLSDSTSTTDSTLAATSTAVKSAYDLAAAAIPKSTVTTNGDLIYGTGSSTVTRRAIGTTGQVLTVSGGVPTWATPASSGAMTQLASGSLSGTTVNISSISQDYRNLWLLVKGFTPATNDASLNGQVNFNSSSSYTNRSGGAVSDYSIGNTSWNNLSYGAKNNSESAYNICMFEFVEYASTANYKTVLKNSFTKSGSATGWNYVDGFAQWNNSSAIDSIQIYCSSGNFSSGTYVLYGVK